MDPESLDITYSTYQSCKLCPRMCGVNRMEQTGFCGCGGHLKAARAALHKWEEPCISGFDQAPGGSGAVFFSGCTLRCCFCQNYTISSENYGKVLTDKELAQIFLNLQAQGAHNLNLVTATQYLPHILSALDMVRSRLFIPVVYNCGGYECLETIKALKNYVDIWLPDFKYYDNALALKYSRAADYFETASRAILLMIEQTGRPEYTNETQGQDIPLLKKGVVIRHMVLPSHREDSMKLLHWMKDHLPQGGYLISLMSQYTPFFHSGDYPELNRCVTSYEYNTVVDEALRLGLTQGFMQKKSSAREEYTPPFDLEGLEGLDLEEDGR